VELGGTTSSSPELLSSDSSEYSVYSDKELKLSKRFIFSNVVYQRATYITERRTFPEFPTLPL
jgi:hypothetical protein